MDFNISRKKSVLFITLLTAIAGAPAAVSLTFFDNQDWAWGLGLILSGAFFMIAVLKSGVRHFVADWLKPLRYQKLFLNIFRILFYFIIPLEFVLMMGWWLVQSIAWYPETWWNPFEKFSLGTAFFQWALILVLGLLFNSNFVKALKK
jgi:NSS family neurotransmitter:Na+ symporter